MWRRRSAAGLRTDAVSRRRLRGFTGRCNRAWSTTFLIDGEGCPEASVKIRLASSARIFTGWIAGRDLVNPDRARGAGTPAGQYKITKRCRACPAVTAIMLMRPTMSWSPTLTMRRIRDRRDSLQRRADAVFPRIHGASACMPATCRAAPASHGCIRMPELWRGFFQ